MSKTKAIFILLLVLALIIAGCKKKPPQPDNEPEPLELPAATTEGKGTFGCKINGEVYLPNGGIYDPGIDEHFYRQSDGKVWIKTNNLHNFEDQFSVFVEIRGVYDTGIFQYYSADSTIECLERIKDTIISGYPTTAYYEYQIDTTKNYYVEITRLDLTEKIISGKFEFTVFNDYLSDTVVISQGRFDLGNFYIAP